MFEGSACSETYAQSLGSKVRVPYVNAKIIRVRTLTNKGLGMMINEAHSYISDDIVTMGAE